MKACARCGQKFGLGKSKFTGLWYCTNIMACDARVKYQLARERSEGNAGGESVPR